MDNKIFNVNGKTLSQLENTIKLCLTDEYNEIHTVKGYVFSKEKGLVLLWYINPKNDNEKPFDIPLDYQMVSLFIWNWLKSNEANEVTLDEMEEFLDDYDVTCDEGFRVYCESWGRIDTYTYSLFAVKKVYCWYGK